MREVICIIFDIFLVRAYFYALKDMFISTYLCLLFIFYIFTQWNHASHLTGYLYMLYIILFIKKCIADMSCSLGILWITKRFIFSLTDFVYFIISHLGCIRLFFRILNRYELYQTFHRVKDYCENKKSVKNY